MTEYNLVSAIYFTDGGDPEGCIVHTGDKASCERMRDLMDAVAYSGNRPVRGAALLVIPTSEFAPAAERLGDA